MTVKLWDQLNGTLECLVKIKQDKVLSIKHVSVLYCTETDLRAVCLDRIISEEVQVSTNH